MDRTTRICVIGEWLHGLADEGIHNLAQNLIDQWKKEHQVSTIKIGADIPVNRLFISSRLRKVLRDCHPDIIFYISPSSANMPALLRAKMIKTYSSRAKVWVIATQPAIYGPLERWLLPLFSPDGIFVQFQRGNDLLHNFRCPVHFLPSGVDLGRFIPIETKQRSALRKSYGVDENSFVVLHVGHINHRRNIEILSDIAQIKQTQVILVGSASTPQDEYLINQLSQKNVRIFRDFIPNIQELYQLADVYVFPVNFENAAIGVPLSVLEAMACNLPVITTRFGGLPQMFQEGQGLFYFDSERELSVLISKARSLPHCLTRQMVDAYTWDRIARNALDLVQKDDVLG